MAPSAVGDLDRLGAIPRYQIALVYDPATRSIQGDERIVATNRWSSPLTEAYLRLYPNGRQIFGAGRMDLLRVSDDHGDLVSAPGLDTSIVRVDLRQPWQPGEAITLTLQYGAQVPNGTGASPSYGLFQESDGTAVLADSFPMLAVYDGAQWHLDQMVAWGDPVFAESALFELAVTVPQGHTVVSSGVRVAAEADPDGTVTYLVRTGPVRELEIVITRPHETLSARVNETYVRSWFRPEHRLGGERALQAAVDSVTVYNRFYGEYPFSELDVVEAPLAGVLGMEYPGLVLLMSSMYADADPWRLRIAAAHEVAHQWWYSVVGNDIFNEPWLDEALATFSSSVYVEAVGGPPVHESQLRDWEARWQSTLRAGLRGGITWPATAFSGWVDYSPFVYYRGAQFFQALREDLGDEAFFRGLQRYFQKEKYLIATGTDLRAAFSVASGRDLSSFYSNWLDVSR